MIYAVLGLGCNAFCRYFELQYVQSVHHKIKDLKLFNLNSFTLGNK